jgi:hypothetical protein
MPNKKLNLAEMFTKIKEANLADSSKRITVGPGTYNVKCIGAEVKKSLKGKQMAMLTFAVLDGDCKGGTTKQYTIIDDFDEANPWKYATLVNVLTAYSVNLDQVCSVADTMEEALAMATTKLAKKAETSNPNVLITLTRKENGTNSDGRPIYRDYYTFAKLADADIATCEAHEASADKDSSGEEDSFYQALENN